MRETDIGIAYTPAMGLNDLSISPAQRRAFGQALASAMELRGFNQPMLAELLGTSQSVISQYCHGKFNAMPGSVFAIEEALKLPPGLLSHHFGYYPPAAINATPDVESAILGDPGFSDNDRKALLAMVATIREYQAATEAETTKPKPARRATKRSLKVGSDGA